MPTNAVRYASLILAVCALLGAIACGTSAPAAPLIQTAVAFTAARDGQWDIHIASLSDDSRSQVTDSPERERLPMWSPDGKRLLFVEDRDSDEVALFAVNADGTGLRSLASGFLYGVRWSPDGSKVSFFAADAPFGERWNSTLRVIDAESGVEVASMPDAGFHVWGGNTEALLMYAHEECNEGHSGVSVLSLASLQSRPLAPLAPGMGCWLPFARSPKGDRLAWVNVPRGVLAGSANDATAGVWLWITDSQGGGAIRATKLAGRHTAADYGWQTFLSESTDRHLFQRSWSPDGSRLAVSAILAERTDRLTDEELAGALAVVIVDPERPGAPVTTIRVSELVDDWDREAYIESLDWLSGSEGFVYAVVRPAGYLPQEHWSFYSYDVEQEVRAALLPDVGGDSKACLACCGRAPGTPPE